MKIWKAELILCTTLVKKEIEQRLDFYFEEMEGDFREDTEYAEYVSSKDYTNIRIPKQMKYEKIYDNIDVTQGFDHELNKEELDKLKEDMKKFMIKNLEYEKEMFDKSIDKNINMIKSN